MSDDTPPGEERPLTAATLMALESYARHRPDCPESRGPGDCTCGLYALLLTIQCSTCGHRINHHTDRDVADVVGWPCMDCKSARCRGFTLAARPAVAPGDDLPVDDCDHPRKAYCKDCAPPAAALREAQP